MMKKVKQKVSSVFTYFIMIFSLLLVLLGVVPRLFGYSGYYVSSESMSPNIKKGALVFVREVDFEEIEIGDVLTFTREGSEKWFSHRVTEIDFEEKTFKTKGDNNSVSDPGYISYSSVVGRVEKQLPLIGFIPLFLSTTAGKTFLILAYVLYIAVEIENYSTKKSRKKKGVSE